MNEGENRTLEFAPSAKAALLCQEGLALEEPSMFQ